MLAAIGKERRLPDWISVGNGTEFTLNILDHLAYWNGVELGFSRPGKLTDNPHVKVSHGTLR